MIQRTITSHILEYLDEKIVLISGPRQVGKTFLSKNLARSYQYFNFDEASDKKSILKKDWERNGDVVILDEVHKLKNWKSWIKGIFDTEKGKNKFILTGSAKLDTFKKSGESLAGRHISVRLNPLSVKEVGGDPDEVLLRMLKLGSFPEPFLSGSEKKAAVWRRSHLDAIVKQDLVFEDAVRDLNAITLLIQILRSRVGQQIVYKNLADELGVSPPTVKKWIQILESLFIIFIVYPYTKKIIDAVKKEPKIFFYDIGQVDTDPGFKLENLVALHLLKRNQFLEDTEGKSFRLCYIRDKKKREIDFAIEENNQLTHLIEVKTADDQFNTSLNYFSLKLKPKHALQIVLILKRNKDFENFKVRGVASFLMTLET